MPISKTVQNLFAMILGLSLLYEPRAKAASFGCESVAGSVILKDTFYGAVTGTLLSGLVLLAANGDGGDSGSVLAAGTAVGGALGLGLGIAEVSLRDCPPYRYGQEKGFHSSIVALPDPSGQLGSGLRLSWNF